MIALPVPSNDAPRLEQLRVQQGRARVLSPSLTAALGGTSILPGRAAEAYEIWRGLCARAEGGDVGASEDLVQLTALLAGQLGGSHQIGDQRALVQTALEAAALPRHRQELLGRLCRLAVCEREGTAALEVLAAMTIDPPDIESDSELRVSAAAVATLAGDGERVLALLGRRGGAIPIHDSQGDLASVLRANAHELLGDVGSAAEVLRELPHSSRLAKVQQSYAALGLCPRSSALFAAVVAQVQGAKPAGLDGLFYIGVLLTLGGVVAIGATFLNDSTTRSIADIVIPAAAGLLCLFLGPIMVLAGIDNARNDVYLRKHGIPRTARVLKIDATGSRIGEIPIYILTLEVAGENGPYQAIVRKSLHAPQASAIIGQEIHIVAHPNKPTVIMLDE